ncbi:hypothetical protein GPALN_005039 [Globodera pallida]|nr:hypothetical protein GPALN_005039 [Globodera pallida]
MGQALLEQLKGVSAVGLVDSSHYVPALLTLPIRMAQIAKRPMAGGRQLPMINTVRPLVAWRKSSLDQPKITLSTCSSPRRSCTVIIYPHHQMDGDLILELRSLHSRPLHHN